MRIAVYLIPKDKKWTKLKKEISKHYINDKSRIYPAHISVVWSRPIKNKNFIKEINSIKEFNKEYKLKIKKPFSKIKPRTIVIHFKNNYGVKRLIEKANDIAKKYYKGNKIFKAPLHMTLAYGQIKNKEFNKLKKIKINNKFIIFTPKIVKS